jgi:hypothetical protein
VNLYFNKARFTADEGNSLGLGQHGGLPSGPGSAELTLEKSYDRNAWLGKNGGGG